MTTLQLVGWKPGLQTVSLVQLVKNESTGSLIAAKRLVDELFEGRTVEVRFKTVEQAKAFRERAEALGAILRTNR